MYFYFHNSIWLISCPRIYTPYLLFTLHLLLNIASIDNLQTVICMYWIVFLSFSIVLNCTSAFILWYLCVTSLSFSSEKSLAVAQWVNLHSLHVHHTHIILACLWGIIALLWVYSMSM